MYGLEDMCQSEDRYRSEVRGSVRGQSEVSYQLEDSYRSEVRGQSEDGYRSEVRGQSENQSEDRHQSKVRYG